MKPILGLGNATRGYAIIGKHAISAGDECTHLEQDLYGFLTSRWLLIRVLLHQRAIAFFCKTYLL